MMFISAISYCLNFTHQAISSLKKYPLPLSCGEDAKILDGIGNEWINSVCSDEGLTLKMSAKHHIPQATNIPYQPLLIKPIYNEWIS